LECKWHPDQQVQFTCIKCAQQFCRECVGETRGSHYCPDCHREELQRFASQLGGRDASVKHRKVKAVKRAPAPSGPPRVEEMEAAPRAPAEPPGVELPEPVLPELPGEVTREDTGKRLQIKKPKPLRRPFEKPVKPGKGEAPAAPEAPVPGSLSPEERAAFWGDIEHPRQSIRRAEIEPLPELEAPEEIVPAPARGMAEPAGKPPVAEEAVKMPAPAEETVETVDAATLSPVDLEEEELVPSSRRRGKHVGRAQRLEVPVAMQIPDDYDGQLTDEPSYFRAVMWALLVGILLAGAYAGFEYWQHSGRWIFGWVIGVAVGIAVALGSGRHFNWKLGLIAAGISVFCLCLGQVVFKMMDVRFNAVVKLPVHFMNLLKISLIELGKQFGSLWVLLFILTGGVAFLLSFRPWPIRLQTSGPAETSVRRT